MSTRTRTRRYRPLGRRRRLRPCLEILENRLVLSVTRFVNLNLVEFHDPSRVLAGEAPGPNGILPLVGGLPFPIGYEPSDISTAYGIGNITFGSVTGDGTGQTIAIVDAYDDPAFVNSSEHAVAIPVSPAATSPSSMFSSAFPIQPSASRRSTSPGRRARCPATDPAGAGNVNGNWEIEEALDIEWAHAIAPGAQHRSRRGIIRQQRRPVRSGDDGCEPSRRLGCLDELGLERIQRTNRRSTARS